MKDLMTVYQGFQNVNILDILQVTKPHSTELYWGRLPFYDGFIGH